MKSTDCAQLDGCTRALVEQVERLELNESRRNCCEKVICAGIEMCIRDSATTAH